MVRCWANHSSIKDQLPRITPLVKSGTRRVKTPLAGRCSLGWSGAPGFSLTDGVGCVAKPMKAAYFFCKTGEGLIGCETIFVAGFFGSAFLGKFA